MNPIRAGVEEYVHLKQKLGFQFFGQSRDLRMFVEFMEKKRRFILTRELAVAWAQGDHSLAPWLQAKRLSNLRGFAQYWKTIEPRTELWPTKLMAERYQRKAPHIYSDDEIQNLLAECGKLQDDSLRPYTLYTIFGLIAVTGMRTSEACSLTRNDVDLKSGIITIRRTKFNKTRMIPLHPTTVDVLRDYAYRRDQFFPALSVPHFFISGKGKPIRDGVLTWSLCSLGDRFGLRKWMGTERRRYLRAPGPRIHDFRHTFAVRALERWHRLGENVDAKIPVLSAYLGHSNPECTYWYLSITPELMKLVGKRLDFYMGGFLS